MGCINYNCDTLPEHEISIGGCGSPVPGGMSNAVILECGHLITDPSDGAAILAEIAAGRAKKIQNVKIGMPLGSPINSEVTTSCSGEKVVNYDRTLTLEDYNVSSSNNEFWSTVFGGRSFGGIILFECEDDEIDPRVTFINKELTAEGGLNKPNVNSESQKFEGTFKWRSRTLPEIAPAPTGIFS